MRGGFIRTVLRILAIGLWFGIAGIFVFFWSAAQLKKDPKVLDVDHDQAMTPFITLAKPLAVGIA